MHSQAQPGTAAAVDRFLSTAWSPIFSASHNPPTAVTVTSWAWLLVQPGCSRAGVTLELPLPAPALAGDSGSSSSWGTEVEGRECVTEHRGLGKWGGKIFTCLRDLKIVSCSSGVVLLLWGGLPTMVLGRQGGAGDAATPSAQFTALYKILELPIAGVNMPHHKFSTLT